MILLLLALACEDVADALKGDAADEDGDGFPVSEDCNDNDANINPDALEVCDPDEVDENCNSLADNADPTVWDAVTVYHDADDDGYGNPDLPSQLCEVIAHYPSNADDCNDQDPDIGPHATEVCDPNDIDEDCDGDSEDDDEDLDESTLVTYYEDVDGDGWGGSNTQRRCNAGPDYVDVTGDCDDLDPDVYPGAMETWYDGDDANCDDASDYDRDGDGHDAEAYGGRDCDDSSAAAYPGGTEIWYDGIDEDCDGDSDYDQDGDGYDSEDHGGTDCDDEDEDFHPGALESGSIDYNCSGDGEPTPSAIAGYDRASPLETCTPILLDGTDSSDPDGLALAYTWELLDQPSAGTHTSRDIEDTSDAEPTFTPRFAGDYAFGLTVTNSSGVDSPLDRLDLSVTERTDNTAPVANAGADQTESITTACTSSGYVATCDDCAETTFTLSAASSTDAESEPLSYAWAVTTGTATLSASTGESVVLTVPAFAGTSGTSDSSIVVTLTATDCFGDTDTDTITLTVECTGS